MRPIPLATGEWFFPNQPDVEKITIPLIASSLSKLCRYTGHTAGFYSVAQHSVHVAKLMIRNGHPEYALEGLMHDAAEAFVNDLSAPVKETMPEYQRMEDKIKVAIWEKFGCDPAAWPYVKQADRDSYATEVRDLFPTMDREWTWTFYGKASPDEERISCWSPDFARIMFIKTHVEVTREPQPSV